MPVATLRRLTLATCLCAAAVAHAEIWPAADWIEREITDLYKVEFTGHPHPERLIRPVQLEAGMFREPGGAAGKERR